MSDADPLPPMLTTQQVADYLGLKRQTLEQWRAERNPDAPPFVRLAPRCIRYRRDDLLAWIDARAVEA